MILRRTGFIGREARASLSRPAAPDWLVQASAVTAEQ
jgi:hypothetical protein